MFDNDEQTKDLREPDIRRYRALFKKAKKASKEIRSLQEDAEQDIGDRHRAGIGNWRQAIKDAKIFFASKRFTDEYRQERATIGDTIGKALDYPNFNFDPSGFEEFYGIAALGHLIAIRKPSVWRQRKKLQQALKYLIDDGVPIERRLQAVLDPKGRFKVDGVGLNFISKVLAVHDDQEFTVHNAPIQEALAHFEYEPARGYTVSQKYIEFCNEMKRFQTETSARSSLDVDGFFYDYWERRIKPKKASQR